MQIRKLAFLILLFNSITLLGQNPYYINFDIEDGLPSSEVYDIEIDQNGLVWITTDRGVCSYDGYQFKTYTTKDGLVDNTNFEIFRDSKNRLWLNGYNGKLSVFENNSFHPYRYNDSLVELLKGRWIAEIINPDGDDLYFSLNSTEEGKIFTLNKDKPPSIADNTKIIFNQKNGFFLRPLINKKQTTLFFYQSKAALGRNSHVFYSNLPIKKNSHWFFFTNTSINKLNEDTKTEQQYKLNATIDYIYFDKNDDLWVCTFDGLFLFKNGDLSKPPKHYFKNNNITSITNDLEGNYWVSTIASGIYLIPSFKMKTINSINKEKYLSIGLLKNNILFGTSKPQITTVDTNYVSSNIWLDSGIEQIRYISKNNNKLSLSNGFESFEKNKKVVIQKISERAASFVKRLNNNELLLVSENRLILTKQNQKKIINSPLNQRITSLEESKSNDLWVGTLTGYYKIENYDLDDWHQIFTEDNKSLGRVNDIYLDKYNNQWIATIGNGLIYHDNKRVFKINQQEGLNSNFINHINVVNDTTVWVATNKGLNYFNYQFKNDSLVYSKIKNLTSTDGLASNYINDVDYWKGEIWLATNAGITHFDPKITNRTFPKIPVAINDLIVNDSIYNTSNDLVFNHDENDIYINYTGISFRKNDNKLKYRYRLLSGEKNVSWFYTNEKNIRYNNLPPKKYTFEVAAQNRSGEWNDKATKLSFTIKSHFSQTLWFKLLSLLLVVVLVYFLINSRIKRLKSKELEKLKLQEAQLRTRSAELSSLRNQMNPHFVYNSLNSIQNFIFKKDVKKANHYMSRFSTLMRKSLQYSRLELITIEEEIAFLKNYLELETMRFPNMFDINYKINDELPVDIIMIPSLLLQPIVENVIKHAFKEIHYKGFLEVIFTQKTETQLEIIIRDNGNGYNKEKISKKKQQSLGLDIIKDRIKLLNEGKSLEMYKVDFVNLADSNVEKTGLEVQFTFPIIYKS